jgi:sulfide dehydrogenase cytochrome subunit
MLGSIPAMTLLIAVRLAVSWVVPMVVPMDVLAAAAQEPKIAAEVCGSCHGAGGVSPNPIVPTLAGQPYTFIEDNLLAFRAGKRSCAQEPADDSPNATLANTMCGFVRGLQDREIADIASWYEGLAFVAAEQPFDPALASRGALLHQQGGCDRCHADGGRETMGIAPVLAGQWTPFLRRALQELRAGRRPGPKEMNGPIRGLDDGEIEALLSYYARPQD